MKEICNAKITGTMLGKEDHGIMTCLIYCEFENGACAYGGYALDTFDKTQKKRVGVGKSIEAIMRILDCVGVDSWEQLKGKYIRIEHTGWGGGITKIGNLIKDKWFSFEEFFNEG